MSTVFGSALVISTVVLFGFDVSAHTNKIVRPPGELKKMGLEQLFVMEITSVSRNSEKLSETCVVTTGTGLLTRMQCRSVSTRLAR